MSEYPSHPLRELIRDLSQEGGVTYERRFVPVLKRGEKGWKVGKRFALTAERRD